MRPLPLPLRVAAGVAAATAEHARELPTKLAELPVTVVSQALQLSMRVQQQVTELAIKGDDALASLRPVEDTPSWATFDEDIYADPDAVPDLAEFDGEPLSPVRNGRAGATSPAGVDLAGTPHGPASAAEDPWAAEERALAEEHADGEFDSAPDTDAPDAGAPESGDSEGAAQAGAASSARGSEPNGPAGLAGYDAMTLPQLRARLRTFTLEQLEEILAYERTHAHRPSFIGMLSRRINNVRNEQ